jgi:predicted metalloendopeptidase
MDVTVDPCEVGRSCSVADASDCQLQDFYQFACGNWDKSHPIPEGRSVRSSFETFVNDVVDLYRGIHFHRPTQFHAAKSF